MSNTEEKNKAVRNIVIIGASYSAIELYIQLINKKKLTDPQIRLVLVSQANFFYHYIDASRALVDESLIQEICVPLDRLVKTKKARFIHGENICFT